MELPPGLLDFIDQYVSEALETTGTRQATTRLAPPPPMETDPDTLIPIHVELEDERIPAALRNLFDDDAPVEPLPRSRAPRSSVHNIPKIELDDEITNLVRKPTP